MRIHYKKDHGWNDWKVRLAFRTLDKNGSGTIDAVEFKFLMTHIGNPLPEHEVIQKSFIRMVKYRKHGQRDNGLKALSTLTPLTDKRTSASKSRLNSSLKISTNFSLKNQLQNLDQYSAPISSPNQLQNLDQSSVSKSWPKVSFKILINTQPQYLHPTSASKSRPNYHQRVPQHQHLQH